VYEGATVKLGDGIVPYQRKESTQNLFYFISFYFILFTKRYASLHANDDKWKFEEMIEIPDSNHRDIWSKKPFIDHVSLCLFLFGGLFLT
jgi:hypothetical protein